MEFSRVLTKVPEHTWGLANTVEASDAWSNAQFQAMNSSHAVLLNELSWTEQRNFNLRALEALSPLPSLQARFTAAIAATSPYVPDLSEYTPVQLKEGQLFKTPSFVLGFNMSTAAITYLLDKSNGRTWASSAQTLAAFHYSTFSAAHMLRFQAAYNMCPPYCDVPGS